MNKFPPILLALSLAFGAQPALAQPAEADCLFFRDGDALRGQLLEIQPHDFIRWQHPDASGPSDFKPETVARIDFHPPQIPAFRADNACKLSLASGDALDGNLVSFDSDTLTLDTWYAGKLKIPRRSLETLDIPSPSRVIFDGFTGLDGWTQGNSARAFVGEAGQWSYRDGAFYSDKAASIARDVKLPDRAQIQFDLAWRNVLNLAVALDTDSLQPILLTDKENGPDFGGFYSLRLGSGPVSLSPIRKKGPLRALGDTLFVASLAQKNRAHVLLRLSRPDHRVALYLDGALVRDWIDPDGFAGEGTGVRFVNNQMGGDLKVSGFRVSRWNGLLDNLSPAARDPSCDTILLESGARIGGALVSIAAGRISMLTAAGATNLPLASATAIQFARPQAGPPAAFSVNTRATFVQGGAVAFELLSWRPGGVEALSPDLGRVTWNPAAFARLQFMETGSKKAEEPEK
jgi:hypothetical protein